MGLCLEKKQTPLRDLEAILMNCLTNLKSPHIRFVESLSSVEGKKKTKSKKERYTLKKAQEKRDKSY